MLKSLQKFLTFVVVLIGLLYLLYQAFLFSRTLAMLPQGLTVAGVEVGGLTREEAIDQLNQRYLSPVVVYHRLERIEISPQEVGFTLDSETMLHEAETARTQQDFWTGYLEFLIGTTIDPVQIGLSATHDRPALMQKLQTIASILDSPAQAPLLLGGLTEYQPGESGYETDLEASLPLVESALYRLETREAQLVVVDEEAPAFDMGYLKDILGKQISAFDGFGSVFVLNLDTGEEIGINADVAVSGLSIVKLAIVLETYRQLDFEPNSDQAKLISETAILSGDFSANLLLDVVAGQDNAYLGADILTESMQRLGLLNTFIVTPYEEPARAGFSTRLTPANARTDITTFPDPAMQTTAEDIGSLLAMIYHCSQGGGALLAVYPDELTPSECQAILDIFVQNVEGNLIRFGVPEEVRVSHKHGWATNTHGDAGIVFSPGANYVLVEYLSQPFNDWLVIDLSFPVLREISRATYNYFNLENPNLEDPQVRAEREAEAREAAEQAEAEAAIEAEVVEPTPVPQN